jgi:hypothetical protein
LAGCRRAVARLLQDPVSEFEYLRDRMGRLYGAHFTDLGPDWHDRLAPLRRKHQLITELERLSGKKVTLHDAA